MKPLHFLAVVAAAFGILTDDAFSEQSFETGSSILGYCSTNENDKSYTFELARCVSYISAIDDVGSCEQDVQGFNWQSPSNVTRRQILKVVTKWLNDHPEKLHFAAPGLVAAALSEAFPCN